MENTPYNAPQPPDPEQHKQMRGKSIAGMVLGICSVVMFSIPYVAIVCGIIGLVFSIQVRRTNPVAPDKGFAQAGLICSICGLAISLAYILLFGSIIACAVCTVASYT